MKAYLEPSEVVALEEAAANLRDRLLIRLLFRTGCRVSELVGLAVDDLDLQAGTVRVVRLKQRLRVCCSLCGTHLGGCHQFCPGCGEKVAETVRRALEVRRMRTLSVDQDTADMLRKFVSRSGPVTRKERLTAIAAAGRRRASHHRPRAARRSPAGPNESLRFVARAVRLANTSPWRPPLTSEKEP